MGESGYGIHRVQIRGTGTGLRNRLRRNAKRAFISGEYRPPGGAGQNEIPESYATVPLCHRGCLDLENRLPL